MTFDEEIEQMAKDPELLTQRQVAAMLQVTVKAVQLMRRRREISCVRLGYHTLRIPRVDVERYLQKRRVPLG